MKRFLLALSFLIFSATSFASESTDTSKRLEALSAQQISHDGTSNSVQTALGCGMAQLSRNGANFIHGVETEQYDCTESKIKENGADLQAIVVYSFFEVISYVVLGIILVSFVLLIFEMTKEEKKAGKNQLIATVCVLLFTILVAFPFIKIKTSNSVEYKTSIASIAMVSAIVYASDETITSLSNILTKIQFRFPAVKMPIKSGNTDDFESLMDYTIKSLSRNRQPVVFNYYLEGDKVVGYSYARNMKATMSISLDKQAIAIANKNNFKDMQAYQIAEIQKALSKSMAYANTTAVLAGNAYYDTGAFSNKTFDLKELDSTQLKCDAYSNITDLDNYDKDSIIGAYRKLSAACASTILADEISNYRGITTNAALQSNYLKNNYIAYCVGDNDFGSPKFTYKDAN